jgi:hypothetical protein
MALVTIKKVKNAKLMKDESGTKFILFENVRLSFPHLDKPYSGKGGGKDSDTNKPKYGVVGMLPKKTHVEAKELAVEVIKALETEAKIKVASDKKFIRNGDDSDREEYAGHWTVSAREDRPPRLRDRRKNNVPSEKAAEVFYAGCWGNILVRPWVMNNEYGKRINAGLSAVQFAKDDEAFGGGRISDDDVDDVFDASEDDDLDESEDEDDL